jgi:hypothetical protein
VPLLLHRKISADGKAGYLYLPLFYHSFDERQPNSKTSLTWFFPLFYTERTSPSETSFYSLPFYYTNSGVRTTYGFPLLWRGVSTTDGSYSSFFILPFYWSHSAAKRDNEGAETLCWMFPLWYVSSSDTDSTWLFPGFFARTTRDTGRYMITLLFDRKTNHKTGRNDLDLFLYTLSYSAKEDEIALTLFFGLIGDYEQTSSLFSWHFALIAGYKNIPAESKGHNQLLPLWRYSHDRGSSRLYLPLLLSYSRYEMEGQRALHLVALGILYYQNSDFSRHDQTMGIAMGLLFYHNLRPERKYESYGSLLGLLWHYETEENYEKFSILSFIYSRTETDRGVTHRLMGIPVN